MHTKRKLRWTWMFGGILMVASILAVQGRLGSPREALDAYRKAQQFMESIRVKDGSGFCGAMAEGERIRCTGMASRWFENGELPAVRTYSLRGIQHWHLLLNGTDRPAYTVEFTFKPTWNGQGDHMRIDLIKEGDQFVVRYWEPPGI